MRIVLFTTNNMPGIVAFDHFVKQHPELVVGVFVFPNIPKNFAKRSGSLLKKLRKFALTLLVYKGFETYVYFLFRRLFRKSTPKTFAADSGAVFEEFEDPNASITLERLRSLNPDLIINISPALLRKEVLKLPRLGCYNLHGAALPTYRGVANHFWMFLNEEEFANPTIHEMKENIDEGGIFAEGQVPIGKDWSVHMLNYQCQCAFPELIEQLIERLQNNRGSAREQNEDLACYRSFPKKDDIEELRKMGRRIITFRDFFKSVCH